MSNPRDLADDRRICEAATPGEWWVLNDDSNIHIVVGDQEDRVCECHDGECNPKADSAFISAARTALPYWLDVVEKLRAEVATITEQADEEIARLEKIIADNPR